MGVFDIGCGFGVKIQPGRSPNCVPAPADQKINNGQDPDREVIDSSLHVKRTRQDSPDFYETQFASPAPTNPVSPV